MIPAFQNPRPLSSTRIYHPLIGQWDLDAERWRAVKYSTVIDVGVKKGVGDQERIPPCWEGKIITSAQNCIFSHLTHSVLTLEIDDVGSNIKPIAVPDGQYAFDFSDENNNYFSGEPDSSLLSSLAFGMSSNTIYGGINVLPFPWPIFCYGSRTFRFRIENLRDRANKELTPSDFPIWTLQICVHGLQQIDIEKGESHAAA